MLWADWAVRGSAILAVATYVLSYWWAVGRSSRPEDRSPKSAWTASCGLLLLHSLLAMHFSHHWSLAAAYHHTAQQTAAVTGWHWGGGLFVNCLLLSVWGADILAWNILGQPLFHRWPVANWAWQASVAFLMFNATVVFGPRYWTAAGVSALLFVLVARRRK